MALEKHDKSKDVDEKALTEPTLVSTVEDRLQALNGLDAPAVSDDDDTEDPTPDGKEAVEDVGDDKAEPEEPVDDPTPDKEEEVDKVLPDAFKRAAIHQGWKEGDVDEFFEANPDAALRTFENIYNSTNTLSKQFADMGRAQRQLETAKKPDDSKPVEFEKVDVARLKEEFDLDPATVERLERQNKQLETYAELAKTQQVAPQQEVTRRKVATDAVVEQQIANFFETEQLKPYRKFYGELKLLDGMSWGDLTAGQKDNRYRVLEQADLMIAGAALQGRVLKIDEALGLAHLLVTEPVREQAIREQIRTTATKRTKTLKPSGKKTDVSGKVKDGKPQTHDEIVERAGQRLAKVFGQ